MRDFSVDVIYFSFENVPSHVSTCQPARHQRQMVHLSDDPRRAGLYAGTGKSGNSKVRVLRRAPAISSRLRRARTSNPTASRPDGMFRQPDLPTGVESVLARGNR